MPTFLISAIIWQVMFCAVIWTLEKQCKKKSWCHVCFSKMVIVTKGHVTSRSSRKARDLASGSGEGWRYRKHSALLECSVSMQAVAYVGRQPAEADGQVTKAQGESFETQWSLASQTNALQVCYGFYSCNLWYQNHFLEFNSAARIKCFSPFWEKKKWQCSYLTFVHRTLLNE